MTAPGQHVPSWRSSRRSTTSPTPASTTSATSPRPTAAPTGPAGAGWSSRKASSWCGGCSTRPTRCAPCSACRGGSPSWTSPPSTRPPTPRTPTRWPGSSGSTSTGACWPSPTGRRRRRWPTCRRGRLLAVLEGVNDHENLGALFRNAAALGVDGVLLGPRCADPLYRRSVRVSMGHVLRVPFAPLPEPWPDVAHDARPHDRRTDARARRRAAGRCGSRRPTGRAAARRGGPGPLRGGAGGRAPARADPHGDGRRLSQCGYSRRRCVPRGRGTSRLRAGTALRGCG